MCSCSGPVLHFNPKLDSLTSPAGIPALFTYSFRSNDVRLCCSSEILDLLSGLSGQPWLKLQKQPLGSDRTITYCLGPTAAVSRSPPSNAKTGENSQRHTSCYNNKNKGLEEESISKWEKYLSNETVPIVLQDSKAKPWSKRALQGSKATHQCALRRGCPEPQKVTLRRRTIFNSKQMVQKETKTPKTFSFDTHLSCGRDTLPG